MKDRRHLFRLRGSIWKEIIYKLKEREVSLIPNHDGVSTSLLSYSVYGNEPSDQQHTMSGLKKT